MKNSQICYYATCKNYFFWMSMSFFFIHWYVAFNYLNLCRFSAVILYTNASFLYMHILNLCIVASPVWEMINPLVYGGFWASGLNGKFVSLPKRLLCIYLCKKFSNNNILKPLYLRQYPPPPMLCHWIEINMTNELNCSGLNYSMHFSFYH